MDQEVADYYISVGAHLWSQFKKDGPSHPASPASHRGQESLLGTMLSHSAPSGAPRGRNFLGSNNSRGREKRRP